MLTSYFCVHLYRASSHLISSWSSSARLHMCLYCSAFRFWSICIFQHLGPRITNY
uniref:Uncharacterized protein n=1 Tax=Aegilops tauschii subsp. strangulata TaxID=200361 RepID=A0A453QT29_AEGTS